MPDILKPDIKAVAWLLAGMFLLPRALMFVRGKVGGGSAS